MKDLERRIERLEQTKRGVSNGLRFIEMQYVDNEGNHWVGCRTDLETGVKEHFEPHQIPREIDMSRITNPRIIAAYNAKMAAKADAA